jgi:O-antigen ligase
MALQDGSPLATAFLGILYQGFFRRNLFMWRRFCVVIGSSLACVAIANIALWCIGMSGDAGNFLAQGAALYWFTLGRLDLDPPLYVGLMPDGFFRAMWITGTLYLPALMYCIAARRISGVLLFSAALLATYTRSLWLAALLGIVLAQALSTRRARFIDGRVALGLCVAGIMGITVLLLGSAIADGDSVISLVSARVGSTFSDESAGERFEQIGPLLDKWSQAPWLGNGFGAHANLIRSDDAPYSYELTVLALLMKTGVAGLLYVLALFAGLWLSALLASRSRGSAAASAGLAAIVAFSTAAATNPFLLNFVGMSALSFMIMKLHIERPDPRA